MKNKHFKNSTIKRVTAFVLLICTLILCASCTGVDPNVKQTKSKTSSYKVETTSPKAEVEKDGFNAYGDGLTDPVKLKGVKVDVNSFAIRSYELAILLGTGSFKNPSKLPVDMLIQYGFAHLSFDDLYKIPKNKVLYRKASAGKINKELKKHFGAMNVDLKKSTLYNKGKKYFEMWLPNYGSNVYYRVDAADVSKDKVEIITTFFKELKKSSKLGRTTLTVKLKDGKPVISSMTVG